MLNSQTGDTGEADGQSNTERFANINGLVTKLLMP